MYVYSIFDINKFYRHLDRYVTNIGNVRELSIAKSLTIVSLCFKMGDIRPFLSDQVTYNHRFIAKYSRTSMHTVKVTINYTFLLQY